MSKKTVLFSLFLTIFISYSFLGNAQENKSFNSKSCNEVRELLQFRKNNLLIYNSNKKQSFSDISSSLDTLTKSNNLGNKSLQKIADFKEEYSIILFERDDLILRIENLLKLNCEIDKKNYYTRLDTLNSIFKNLIKKEKKLIDDFSKNIKPSFEIVKK